MPLAGLRNSVAGIFDRIFTPERQAWLDRVVVNISIAGFLIHLALIFLARVLSHPPALIAAVGPNYLSAIYTPFSFILFYEVLLLITALPQSTTQSIAKQYEIVSLIFIRRFFKDIAQLDDFSKLGRLSPETLPVFLDVGGGLVMFFLVTAFLHLAHRRKGTDTMPVELAELKKFISRKKAIALGLAILLLALAAYNLAEFASDVYATTYLGVKEKVDTNAFFYADVFMVMIFTDVLIVILSLVVSDRYELVFRNAEFVISTILIRFSLTVAQPYSTVLALSGMLFGIATLAIYDYHLHVRRTH